MRSRDSGLGLYLTAAAAASGAAVGYQTALLGSAAAGGAAWPADTQLWDVVPAPGQQDPEDIK